MFVYPSSGISFDTRVLRRVGHALHRLLCVTAATVSSRACFAHSGASRVRLVRSELPCGCVHGRSLRRRLRRSGASGGASSSGPSIHIGSFFGSSGGRDTAYPSAITTVVRSRRRSKCYRPWALVRWAWQECRRRYRTVLAMSAARQTPSPARVAKASAAAGAAVAAFAVLRGARAPARAGIAAAAFSAPFFALREVFLVSSHARDKSIASPVASSVAGGLFGYVAALVSGASSAFAAAKTAVAVGATCGVFDVVVTHIDWSRKVYIVNTEIQRLQQDRLQQNDGEDVSASRSGSTTTPHVNVFRPSEARHVIANAQSPSPPPRDILPWYYRWPSWFPVLKAVDFEYEELLRRREATLSALEEEQNRIASLLEALEAIKARKSSQESKLSSTSTTSSSTSTISTTACSITAPPRAASSSKNRAVSSPSLEVRTCTSDGDYRGVEPRFRRRMNNNYRNSMSPSSQTMSDVTDPASPLASPPASP